MATSYRGTKHPRLRKGDYVTNNRDTSLEPGVIVSVDHRAGTAVVQWPGRAPAECSLRVLTWTPSPEQVAESASAIKSQWSPAERRRRCWSERAAAQPYELPQIPAAVLTGPRK